MNSVSTSITQNSITKRTKIHRSRPAIAQKVVAFQELISLEHNKKSAREAANLLFESLVRNVRIPERPKPSLVASKKRLVA